MKKTIFLFTVLFCCIINSLAQEKVELEEYEVYKAWLEKVFITPDTKQLFILKITASFRDFNDFYKDKRRALSQIQSSALKNYRLRNGNSSELEDNFDVKPIVNLTSEKDLSDFWANDSAYTDFGKKFGAEYRIVFSRVGFNKKKNQALIHIYYKSNSLPKYAFGYFFLLSKEKGEWVANYRVKSWEF